MENIEYIIKEVFSISGRGLVAVLNGKTDFCVGRPYQVEVISPKGEKFETKAFKEWLLKREPVSNEEEAFLLLNLSSEKAPIGSLVKFLE